MNAQTPITPSGVEVISDGQGVIVRFDPKSPTAGAAWAAMMDRLAGPARPLRVNRYKGLTPWETMLQIDAEFGAPRKAVRS